MINYREGFNYSFDVLIIFPHFFIKKKKEKHMKGSIFVLKPHSFHDFIGCFGNVMLDKGIMAGQIMLSCQESQRGRDVYRDSSSSVINP